MVREEVGASPAPWLTTAQPPVETGAGGVIGVREAAGQRPCARGGTWWGAPRDTEAACVADAEGIVNQCLDSSSCQQAVGRDSGSVCGDTHATVLSSRNTAVGTASLLFLKETASGAQSIPTPKGVQGGLDVRVLLFRLFFLLSPLFPSPLSSPSLHSLFRPLS